MAHYQHLPIDNLDHRPTDQRQRRRDRRIPWLADGREVRIRERVVATAIDLVIIGVLTYGFSFWSVGLMGYDPNDVSDRSPPAALAFGVAFLGLIVFGVVGEIIAVVGFRRTIGKRLMRLTVADAGFSKSSASNFQLFKRTLVRTLLLYGIGMGVPIVVSILSGSGILTLATLLVVSSVVFFSMSGIGTDDMRGVHDRVSGTEVIRT